MNKKFWIILLTVEIAILVAWLSYAMNWDLTGDSAVMRYVAWLYVEHGYLPYKEITSINMPGVIALNGVLECISDSGDQVFRFFDLFIMAVKIYLGFVIMRKHGFVQALMVGSLLGAIHLASDKATMLQRDMLVSVFLLAVMVVHAKRMTYQFWISGLLIGVASTIKPTAVLIAILPIIIATQKGEVRAVAICIRKVGIASTVPWMIASIWMIYIGVFPAFVNMLLVELPVHNGPHTHGLGTDWMQGLSFRFAFIALLGTLAWRMRKEKNAIFLMGALIAVAHLVVQGKYLGYHFYPVLMTATLLAVQVLMQPKRIVVCSAIPVMTVVLFVRMHAMRQINDVYEGYKTPTCNDIAHMALRHLPQQSSIQPFGAGKNSHCGLQLANMRPATPLVYNTQVVCYTPELRKQFQSNFMHEIQTEHPDGILMTVHDLCYLRSYDKQFERFPELKEMLDAEYVLVEQTASHRMYKRRDIDPASRTLP